MNASVLSKWHSNSRCLKNNKGRLHICSLILTVSAPQATKAKQAQSRIKALERMTLLAPAHVDSPFQFEFLPPRALPNPLLKLENVRAGYGETSILQQINFQLLPGSRIGLLGRNGAGKSTLIKLLSGAMPPQAGDLWYANGVSIGYFAQHQLETLRPQDSPLQHLVRLAPQATEQSLRDFVGGFGFHGDKALAPVRSLFRWRESPAGAGLAGFISGRICYYSMNRPTISTSTCAKRS